MIWRPFTQEQTTPAPLKIVRGEGIYLYTEDGKKYADMISSWWVNILGHGNKEIADAISEQAHRLEQVILTAFTHQPAEDLVARLQTVLPAQLNKFFFSDNGSTSVEVALKMAYQFFKNNGQKRKIYLHFDGSYHGDTFGAMSVSGHNSMYHFNFADFFFDTIAVRVPEFYDGVENIEQKEDESIRELEKNLERYGDQICALIVEPLVQGAKGMVMHRPEFLDRVMRTVRKFGILVIFDEVFTGFYRTGRFFAMDHVAEKPDIVCISKALTGGFLPLAVTVATEEIYTAFLSDDPRKALIHGHSYTGNPIACAAACKTFEILSRATTLENIKKIETFHKSVQLENISKRRALGVISAFDLPHEKVGFVVQHLFDKGIFLRPLGDTIYLIPPYCATVEELTWVYGEIINAK